MLKMSKVVLSRLGFTIGWVKGSALERVTVPTMYRVNKIRRVGNSRGSGFGLTRCGRNSVDSHAYITASCRSWTGKVYGAILHKKRQRISVFQDGQESIHAYRKNQLHVSRQGSRARIRRIVEDSGIIRQPQPRPLISRRDDVPTCTIGKPLVQRIVCDGRILTDQVEGIVRVDVP